MARSECFGTDRNIDMAFHISVCRNTPEEFKSIASLLISAFVDEGHTDAAHAGLLTSPTELQKRGEIFLARDGSNSGELLGMAILVRPISPARQVAEADEAELHLLAVSTIARGRGIGAALTQACEARALAAGFKKMVLSTQPTMKAAHHVYERLGYNRNPARDWTRANGRSFLVYEKSLT